MAQAIVDPDELRRFAHNLDRFNRDLQGQIQVLRGQMKNLSQSWRDQEHDKFVQQFDETVMVMNRFVAISTEQIPVLLRKAERVEEYLRQR